MLQEIILKLSSLQFWAKNPDTDPGKFRVTVVEVLGGIIEALIDFNQKADNFMAASERMAAASSTFSVTIVREDIHSILEKDKKLLDMVNKKATNKAESIYGDS